MEPPPRVELFLNTWENPDLSGPDSHHARGRERPASGRVLILIQAGAVWGPLADRRQINPAPDGTLAPWKRTMEPKGKRAEGDCHRATARRNKGDRHLRPLRPAARHQGARGTGCPGPALRRLLLGAGNAAAGQNRHATCGLTRAMQRAVRRRPQAAGHSTPPDHR